MDFDILVVGAGPAGALAAREAARAGQRVGIFDRAGRESLSQPVIIEAEKSVFGQVAVRPPEGDEVPYHARDTRVFSPLRREVFRLGPPTALALYLDRFSRRLLEEAEAAGAKFFDGHAAAGPLLRERSVLGAVFRHGGRESEVRARVTIDATGYAAALTRNLAALGIELVAQPTDVVLAANALYEVDPEGARAAVAQGRAADGEIWNRLGVHGNYSTEFSFLSLEPRRAYLLIGHRSDYPNPPLGELFDNFRQSQGYFREKLFGGGGRIRVRRSLDRLVADGFMTVGEAACTVIPMHGSGVASAMLTGFAAGRVAAAALAGRHWDPASLWPYAAGYQRGRGAILAGQDASRRIAGTLARERLCALMESGGMQAEDVAQALLPKSATASPRTLPARARAILRHPGLLGTLGSMGWNVKAAERHWRKYPAEYDEQLLAKWRAGAAAVFRGL